MATPVTKEAVKQALGITEKTAPKSGVTLDAVSKGLEVLNNPLVKKYADRLLEWGTRRVGIGPSASELPSSGPNVSVQSSISPADIYEFMFEFIKNLDESITMGQFKNWMIKEKINLVEAIDRAIKSRVVVK